jgi:hypothetical protein
MLRLEIGAPEHTFPIAVRVALSFTVVKLFEPITPPTKDSTSRIIEALI